MASITDNNYQYTTEFFPYIMNKPEILGLIMHKENEVNRLQCELQELRNKLQQMEKNSV